MSDFIPYQPRFANPYPGAAGAPAEFRFESDLRLARSRAALRLGADREAEYVVAADYRVSFRLGDEPARRSVTVPAGMLTDLASVPRVAWSIVGRVGPHLEAAIVHDFLYVAWQDLPEHGARERDFRFANALMLVAMAASGVPRPARALIFAAVSTCVARRIYDRPEAGPRYVRVPPVPAPVPAPAPAPAPARPWTEVPAA